MHTEKMNVSTILLRIEKLNKESSESLMNKRPRIKYDVKYLVISS